MTQGKKKVRAQNNFWGIFGRLGSSTENNKKKSREISQVFKLLQNVNNNKNTNNNYLKLKELSISFSKGCNSKEGMIRL